MHWFFCYLEQPHLVQQEFQDLTDSSTSSGSVVASYTCSTRNYPPTTVTWLRNGDPLVIDNEYYSTTQVITDRVSSSYKSVLLVHKVTEVFGNPPPTYACSISTAGGNVVGYIDRGITG